MSDLKLGEVITDTSQQRDAIHIAVAPVIAAKQLHAGQHVGLVSETEVDTVHSPIGIVDPFLRGYVARGERFWLFLYPNTVTSLRHEWTHPAFKEDTQGHMTESAESEIWLRELAAEIGCTYDYLMDGIPGGRIHTGDREMYGLRSSEDVQRHYRNVTGESVGEVYFSCAC